MVKVYKRETEDISVTISRFKKKVENSGIIQELKDRSAYVKPSEQKRNDKRENEKRVKQAVSKKQRQLTFQENNKMMTYNKHEEASKHRRTLFVGGIPYRATEVDLLQSFSESFQIREVKIILDKETQKSKGFGFVELANEKDIKAFIETFNNFEFQGRKLTVKINTSKKK